MDIALDDGSAFKLDGWKYISEAFPNNTLHFIGLLSDGGVHSRYNQLIGFVKGAAKDGAKRIRVHILTVSAPTPPPLTAQLHLVILCRHPAIKAPGQAFVRLLIATILLAALIYG